MDCTEQTIFVSGIGRSGTTWLSNIINYDHRYRDVFEPLHPTRGVKYADYFKNYQYIPPSETNTRQIEAMRSVLCAREDTEFTTQFNNAPDDAPRLLKSIRLNLSLKWLRVHFPNMPMIYIVRHPALVVKSQMRMGWGNASTLLNRVIVSANEIQYLSPFLKALYEAETEFQRRVLLWFSVQRVLLEQFEPGEMLWVFYDDLLKNPDAEIKRIFGYLQRDYDAEAVSETIKKPSAMTTKKSRSQIEQGYFNQNLRNLSWEEYLYLQRMIDGFGLRDIVDLSDTPLHVRAESLMDRSLPLAETNRMNQNTGQHFMSWLMNKLQIGLNS